MKSTNKDPLTQDTLLLNTTKDSTIAQEETQDNKKMTFDIASFSGPLDLLLFLVKQHKVDIYDIPIADITEQYLRYLNEMLVYDLEDLTSFYEMATWLLLLKSKMLLPVHSDLDEDEIVTSHTELINTLIDYQKYRKLSDMLAERYEQFNWLSLRQENNTLPLDIPQENVWKNVNTLELFSIFMKFMEKPPEYQRIIDLDEPVTINEKMTLIYEILEHKEQCNFDEIVDGGGVVSMICVLLALLELMKQQQVRAIQHTLNEEIIILRGTCYAQ